MFFFRCGLALSCHCIACLRARSGHRRVTKTALPFCCSVRNVSGYLYVVQEQINMGCLGGSCTVLNGGLLAYKTVKGRQLRRLCCEALIYSGSALPGPLLRPSYCILFCRSAVTCSSAAVTSNPPAHPCPHHSPCVLFWVTVLSCAFE